MFQDTESGLRYAITQWEGEQNEVIIQFKRMRLSHNPDDDERTLQIQMIIENILDKITGIEHEVKGKILCETHYYHSVIQ